MAVRDVCCVITRSSATFLLIAVNCLYLHTAVCTLALGNVTFKNGENWQAPDNSCITCTCLNGEISCKDIVCRPDEELNCRKPRRRGVDCCKSCPREERRRNSKKKRRLRKVCLRDTVTRHRRRHKKRWMQFKRGGGQSKNSIVPKNQDRSRRDVDSSSELPPLRELYPANGFRRVPSFYKHMCVPKRSDHLIYRHIENKEMFMAFENLKAEKVEVWKWKLKRKACLGNLTSLERCKRGSGDIRLENSTFTKITYPAKLFRKQVEKVMLFASTTKKQVVGFQRSLQHSMNICTPKGSCRVKMITRKFYYNKLRLYDVFYDCEKCQDKSSQGNGP